MNEQILNEAEERDRLEHERVVDAAFGIWTKYGVSTDEYLKRMRAEWDRDSVWDKSIGAYVSPNDV